MSEAAHYALKCGTRLNNERLFYDGTGQATDHSSARQACTVPSGPDEQISDTLWLKDDGTGKSANLPGREILNAADITADLETALEQFATVAANLGSYE